MFNIFKGIKEFMSDFLTKLDAAIANIVVAHGTATNSDLSNLKTEVMTAIKAEVDNLHTTLNDTQAQLASAEQELKTLRASLLADEGVDSALLARVADVETGLTHVVNHLANGNTEDAANAASTVVSTAGKPVVTESAPEVPPAVVDTTLGDAPAA